MQPCQDKKPWRLFFLLLLQQPRIFFNIVSGKRQVNMQPIFIPRVYLVDLRMCKWAWLSGQRDHTHPALKWGWGILHQGLVAQQLCELTCYNGHERADVVEVISPQATSFSLPFPDSFFPFQFFSQPHFFHSRRPQSLPRAGQRLLIIKPYAHLANLLITSVNILSKLP